MMQHQQMIAPHFDRHLRYNPKDPVAGFRDGWAARMIANCPPKGKARDGYIGALLALNSEALPGAFIRAEDIARFQDQVRGILSVLD